MEYLVALINSFVIVFLSIYIFNIVQLDGYKLTVNKRWAEFYYKILTLAVVGLCIVFTMYSCFISTAMGFLEYVAVILPIISFAYLGWLTFREGRKVGIKYTPRMTRLLFCYFTVVILINELLVFAGNHILIKGYEMRYIFLMLPYILLPIIVIASIWLVYPLEVLIQKKYLKRAKATLDAHPDLIKIGITGSYGKTSVKNILSVILKEKYEVLASPMSYNTPMGLCRTIAQLTPTTKVLIAEMGAKNKGDIKELCDLVNPQFGIITGIGEQHLKSFKTIENIAATKYELVEAISDEGYVVFNGDNKYTKEMYNKALLNKGLASLEIGNCVVSDIKTTSTGSDFILKIDEKSVKCSTMLIGVHNVLNIAMASLLAVKLGVSLEQISHAICLLEPTAHRLEVMKNSRGIVIIDDTYNSNFEGFKAAISTMQLFSGRKVVVTPGIVELGKKQFDTNFEIGKILSKSVAIAFLVGENSLPIKDGMLAEGFFEDDIIMCPTLDAARLKFNQVLKFGDVVLMENDLPDNY